MGLLGGRLVAGCGSSANWYFDPTATLSLHYGGHLEQHQRTLGLNVAESLWGLTSDGAMPSFKAHLRYALPKLTFVGLGRKTLRSLGYE
jgi:hypothetical protein